MHRCTILWMCPWCKVIRWWITAKESENTCIQNGKHILRLYLTKLLNTVSSFILFISKVGWNDWNFVQRFNPGNNIDIISFPATAATSWTLELRFMKKLTYNELFFKIQNFIEITGRNDAGCDFLIGSTVH